MAKKSVVVLGAGFGGLRASMDIAKELRRLKLLDTYEVVLVDRNDCHVFIPLLYKVAASTDSRYAKTCTYDISTLVKPFGIRFLNDEIVGFDMPNSNVQLKTAGALHADYLVVALGSETNFFGIVGMTENALQLKTLESALAIREALAKAFEKGAQPSADEIRILVGGAGPNGIELASEIRHWANQAEKSAPNLRVSVAIVEAMPGLLNGLDARAAKIAARRLAKLNIEVKFNMKITAVGATELAIAENPPMQFDLFIWTGGVKTPELLASLPITKDQRGRPLVENDMAATPNGTIYGIGDSVCFIDPRTGRGVPAVARVAIMEGTIAARNVVAEIKRAEFSSHEFLGSTYRPMDYPYVIPIGECWAVAKLGPIVFSGWFGWAFSRAIELNYLISIMPFGHAWSAWQEM